MENKGKTAFPYAVMISTNYQRERVSHVIFIIFSKSPMIFKENN